MSRTESICPKNVYNLLTFPIGNIYSKRCTINHQRSRSGRKVHEISIKIHAVCNKKMVVLITGGTQMKLILQRKWATEVSTVGELSIDGVFECFVLEDVTRVEKITGKTAIPAGTYRVVVDMSTRFKRLMPHILDVPGFEGIRIHSGNTSADTEGCLLLGRVRGVDFVGESKVAFAAFFTKLQVSGTATIQVIDVPTIQAPELRSTFLANLISLSASALRTIFPQPRQP